MFKFYRSDNQYITISVK